MNKLARPLIIASLCVLFTNIGFAQTNDSIPKKEDTEKLSNQTVDVFTKYTVTIKEARRMEKLPEIVDTLKVRPDFNYDIISKLTPTTFHPTPLTAAVLKGEGKEVFNRGYAKLAIGNKFFLNGDIAYMSKPNPKVNWGIRGKHISSQGKVKNNYDNRVFAGFADSEVSAFAKRIFPKTTLTTDVKFNSAKRYFYGYDIDPSTLETLLPDDRDDFIDAEEYQRYSAFSFETRATSRYSKKSMINYDIDLKYDLWFDRHSNMEHNIFVDADLSKNIKKEIIGLDLNYYVAPTKHRVDPLMIFNVTPYVKHNSEKFKVKLGLIAGMDFSTDSAQYYFHPDVHIEHSIADVILPYASFSGGLRQNPMLLATRENPYIMDTLFLLTANHKQDICVGLKGRMSDHIQFNVNAQYHKVDNEHFYILNKTAPLANRFSVLYSDVEMVRAYAELDFKFKKLGLRLDGTYNYYTWLSTVDEAYHIPSFSSSVNVSYRLLPQLNVDLQAFVEGNRFAGEFDAETNAWKSIKLNPVIDVNLGVEYFIDKEFSAFVRLNNLASQNYEVWQNYKVYGFHFLAGIKYGF